MTKLLKTRALGGCGMGMAIALAVAHSTTELHAANLIVNPGFEEGLAGWESAGAADPIAGLAVLSDDGATDSVLYQLASTEAGLHQLSFDFWNLTSTNVPMVPEETLPDFAYATLYLIDDPAAFDPTANSGFNSSIDLLESELGSDTVLPPEAEVEASSADPRFSTFSLVFDNPLGLAIGIAFRLLDLNFVDADSSWLVDNVAMTRVEPEVAVLMAGPFVLVEFASVLEVSTTLEPGDWIRVTGAADSVAVVPARADGRATELRVVEDGSGAVSLVESALLPGFRHVEFQGGTLQASGTGLGDWSDLPASAGHAIVADPGASQLFFRSVFP